MLSTVGFGGVPLTKAFSRIKDHYRKLNPVTSDDSVMEDLVNFSSEKTTKSNNGVIVKGINNCLVKISHCCNPVPGDDIVGYITRGRGVSVHRKDCTNIVSGEKRGDAERLIKVYWEQEQSGESSYLTEIKILANDRKGLLAEIAGAISELKILITGINSKILKDNTAVVNIKMEINSTEEINQIIRKMKNIQGVFDVERRADSTN